MLRNHCLQDLLNRLERTLGTRYRPATERLLAEVKEMFEGLESLRDEMSKENLFLLRDKLDDLMQSYHG